ncbi:MAG: 50S ribosomal protein L6 [Thermoplasmata archaeon]
MSAVAEIKEEIKIPEQVKLDMKDKIVTVTGPKGTMKKEFKHPRVNLEKKDKSVIIISKLPKRKEKAVVGTWRAHLNNMFKGVTTGFEYRMKIVYAHFPVKTSVKGDMVIVENFLGERTPRKARIVGETKVKIAESQIIINGINIEEVGQTMANIERTTKIKGFDSRIFQDGIYLTSRGVDDT